MYDLLVKLLDSLKGYPLVEAAAAILVILGGLRAIRWGERDRRESPEHTSDHIPAWLLYGPVADLIGIMRQQQTDHQLTTQLQQETNNKLEEILEHLRRAERHRRRLPHTD